MQQSTESDRASMTKHTHTHRTRGIKHTEDELDLIKTLSTTTVTDFTSHHFNDTHLELESKHKVVINKEALYAIGD